MGNRQRAQNIARSNARSKHLLTELTKAVGDRLGPTPHCVDGAALLCATAKILGFKAEPRPVDTFIFDALTGFHAATSERAAMEGHRRGLTSEPRTSNIAKCDGGWSGHMVVSIESPSMICDPTFRQFSVGSTIPSMSLCFDGTLNGGSWEFWDADSGLYVLYLLGEGVAGWEQTSKDIEREWVAGGARWLADQLLSGHTAEELQLSRMPPLPVPTN